MRNSLISLFLGIIIVLALAWNANAQMCGCMGGSDRGMPCGKMEGMEQPGMGMMQGMGMMHGMGGMQAGEMMMGDGHSMWQHLTGLGLDEKQQESLKALRSKTMKTMIKKKAEKEIAGIELRELLDKEMIDMKAVEAAVKKSESLRSEMFLTHIRAHEEMKSILTPEQRKRLNEMMKSGGGSGCAMAGTMGGNAEHSDMPMHQHMP
jgi:Spy/CpxP family protein refolding chaperone